MGGAICDTAKGTFRATMHIRLETKIQYKFRYNFIDNKKPFHFFDQEGMVSRMEKREEEFEQRIETGGKGTERSFKGMA